MQMRFLAQPGDILREAARLVVDQRSDIAVAFWGRGAAVALGLGDALAGTRILLNADSGACNPAELESLLKYETIEVRNCARLHAKVIIGSEMLVGSANMSSNGLGLEGNELRGWVEACALMPLESDNGIARGWFEDLWKSAEPLDEMVIARAARAHRALRQGRIQRGYAGRYLSLDALDGAPIYVVLTDDEITRADRKGFQQGARELRLDLNNVDFYQDWRTMPKDALLFSYQTEPLQANCYVDGWWDTRGSRPIRNRNGAIGHPVFRTNARILREFGAPTTGLRWAKSVNGVISLLSDKRHLRAIRHERFVEASSPTDWCIPLYTFIKLCLSHSIEVPAPWGTPTHVRIDG
jgi:hypothetical protein